MELSENQKSFIERKKKMYNIGQSDEQLGDEQLGYEGGFENLIFEHWVQTKNPLLIWHELKYRLKKDSEIPAWVKDYLLKSAENITSIRTGKNGEAAPMVYKAMQFSAKGRGTVFSSYHDMNQKMLAWSIVIDYLYEFKESSKDSTKEKAYQVVSKIFNVDEETIKKWFKEEGNNTFFDPKKIPPNN